MVRADVGFGSGGRRDAHSVIAIAKGRPANSKQESQASSKQSTVQLNSARQIAEQNHGSRTQAQSNDRSIARGGQQCDQAPENNSGKWKCWMQSGRIAEREKECMDGVEDVDGLRRSATQQRSGPASAWPWQAATTKDAPDET